MLADNESWKCVLIDLNSNGSEGYKKTFYPPFLVRIIICTIEYIYLRCGGNLPQIKSFSLYFIGVLWGLFVYFCSCFLFV